MNSNGGMDGLKRRRPEWSPWLAVIDEIHRETTTTRWEAAVPHDRSAAEPSAPLLSGATIVVDGGSVRRLLQRLLEVAARGGTPKMATLQAKLLEDIEVSALFTSSIRQDGALVAGIAAGSGADVEVLQALVALVSVPFLQACNLRWASSTSRSWTEGYCHVCGSWPAFAEMRGIERSRYLRCGRCGGEWRAHVLHCPYCRTTNHDELVTLVPEKAEAAGLVDACQRCHGYVKAFNRLQGCAPTAVMVEDLGSVDLDVAALEQGFQRPAGAGRPVDVVVNATASSRRFFAWNA